MSQIVSTQYFTFGQTHVHSVNDFTFDKDIVVEITAEDPRQVMFDTFGQQWAMQYDGTEVTPEFLSHFPRGIKTL